MKIGFVKKDITPSIGALLGGYAVERSCTTIHDPLYCKTMVISQPDGLMVLMALDVLCVDEILYNGIAKALAEKGVRPERLIACAIHTHSGPKGISADEGALKGLEEFNKSDERYVHQVICAAVESFDEAIGKLEGFRVRFAQGQVPAVGSERHTGEKVEGKLTVLEFVTESQKHLIIYNFPCHPTVMNEKNLAVTADFVAGIEEKLGAEMSIFINSACGDISTRFTRRESSFDECDRMASLAANEILHTLEGALLIEPVPIVGIHTRITLTTREFEDESKAQERLNRLTSDWQTGIQRGEDKNTIRILKSYVEGAEANLRYCRALKNIKQVDLPVTAFNFCGMKFATIPGELFSTLLPKNGTVVLGYANGYYLYIADKNAFINEYYEAMGSLIAMGEGEHFVHQIEQLTDNLPC